MSLTEIKAAGYKLAQVQYPIFVKKRDDIITSTKKAKKEKRNQDKVGAPTKENVLKRAQEARRTKHDLQMSKKEVDALKESIMRELFFGLSKMDIPEEHKGLIDCGNPTLDGVNYYNILLAMRETLLETHPEEFNRYKS